MSLPKSLEQLLNKYNVNTHKVLSTNPYKERWCLCGIDESGKEVFIKWNGTSNKIHFDKLNFESYFYRVLSADNISPRYMYGENGFFILEYLRDSDTLRNFLLKSTNQNIIITALENTMDAYIKFSEIIADHRDMLTERKFNDCFLECLASLLKSGPADSKFYRFESIFNKFIYLYMKKYIPKVSISTKSAIIHGDYHLNNILIGKDTRSYIIDLENFCIGYKEIELAYWYVQSWALLSNKPKVQKYLENRFTIMITELSLDRDLLDSIISCYKAAISFNRRFHIDESKWPLKKSCRLLKNIKS